MSAMEILRILVVDSDRDSADSLALCVSTFGQIVEVCYSANACLKLLATFRPNIVFLEEGLVSICDAIRELCQPNEVRIIGLKSRSNDAPAG